jgi:hypothetical protein
MEHTGPEPREHGLTCRKCKHVNPSWRTTCERCQAQLPRPEDNPPPERRRANRPGFITGWIILFGAYTLLMAMSFAANIAASATFSPVDLVVLALVGLLMIAVLVVLVALWRMERWARYPTIALQVVVMALLLAQIFFGPAPEDLDASTKTDAPLTTGPSTVVDDADDGEGIDEGQFSQGADIFGTLFFLAINGVYIWYFATHPDAFKPVPDPASARDDA